MNPDREARREENRRKLLEEQAARNAERLARKAEDERLREAERAANRLHARQLNAQDRDTRMRPKEPDIPTPPPAEVTRFGTINNVLTEELRDALVAQRAQCVPPVMAAKRCRVPVDVLYAWLAQGAKDVAANDCTIFADLVLSIEQAGAEAGATLIGHARGGDNWQSAKWLLEQSEPELFGKNVTQVDVNVRAAGIVLQADVARMSNDEFAAMSAAVQARLEEAKGARRLVEGTVMDAGVPSPDGVHVAEEEP